MPHNTIRQKVTIGSTTWKGMGARSIAVNPVYEELGRLVTQFAESFTKITAGLSATFELALRHVKRAELIEASGWLPHRTSPFGAIGDGMAAPEVSDILETYYRDNWPDVRADFAAKVASYDLDEEAKATFGEALAAHECGHYRSVVRLLFPEIERVACKEVYGGKQYEEPEEDGAQAKQITNLTGLREALADLPIGDIGGLDYGFSLYNKLQDHLYRNIGNKPRHIRKYERDPVPNRHASLHGLVSYKSAQSSMNMLVMADFMFGVISSMKKYQTARADDDLASSSGK